jgi:hypothetical protein
MLTSCVFFLGLFLAVLWNPFSLKEEPCAYEGLMRYARQLMGKEEPAA